MSTAVANSPDLRSTRQLRHLSQSVILDEVGPPHFVRLVLLLFSLTVFGFLSWASTITITETTKATGEVIPVGSVLSVQHLEGGIVARILVRGGDLVEAGDVLIELDPTTVMAELEQLQSRRVSLAVRAERLEAFVQNREPDFTGYPAMFWELVKDQSTIFDQQTKSRESQLLVRAQVFNQRRSELGVLRKQAVKIREKVLIIGERKTMREKLLEKGLVSRIVYLNTMQEFNAVTSELETVLGKIRRARQAIAESKSKFAELTSKLGNEAAKEMGTTKAELAEVEQSIVRSKDRVKRLDIRSPARGIVKDLKTNTIGGVIAPGGMISEIVPVGRELIIEARFSPVDVGHVKIGDEAKVKITTFDFARFGTVKGTVRKISATTFKDPDGKVYYKSLIQLAKDHVGDDPGMNKLMPGMIAEIDIKTGEQTLIRYLLRPVFRSLDTAFTER